VDGTIFSRKLLPRRLRPCPREDGAFYNHSVVRVDKEIRMSSSRLGGCRLVAAQGLPPRHPNAADSAPAWRHKTPDMLVRGNWI
jgi:hypothetical protein